MQNDGLYLENQGNHCEERLPGVEVKAAVLFPRYKDPDHSFDALAGLMEGKRV